MHSSRLTAVLAAIALAATGAVAPAAASAGAATRGAAHNPSMPATSKAPVVTGTPYAKADGRKN